MVAETRRETPGFTPEDLKTSNMDGVVNPSSRMIARNPTRIDITNEADDQRDIVDAIKGAQGKRMKIICENKRTPSGKWECSGPPGLTKIREMPEPQLTEFCRTLLRYRPNITGLSLSLGDYESLAPISGRKIERLNFRKPRLPTEVAEDLAAILSDKTLRLAKIDWKINSAGVGAFECICTAMSTTEEEFNDDSKFAPTLTLEYFSF